MRAVRRERGESLSPRILISGAQINNAIKDCFKADCYAATVFDTVRLCEGYCRTRIAASAA